MSLTQWFNNAWIVTHETSPAEIRQLLAVVRRDIEVASDTSNADWRFGVAYNSALKLCTALLYASGFRAVRDANHYRTIQSLPIILGDQREKDAKYLDSCRKKRNELEYIRVDVVTLREADELIEFCKELLADVESWLKENHPELLDG